MATLDELQILQETFMREVKPQQEDMKEDTQTQGIVNLKVNATIVISLVIML